MYILLFLLIFSEELEKWRKTHGTINDQELEKLRTMEQDLQTFKETCNRFLTTHNTRSFYIVPAPVSWSRNGVFGVPFFILIPVILLNMFRHVI